MSKKFDKGALVHARTLDWNLLEGLDALLVDLSARRGDRLLYRCTTFFGFVGSLTALHASGYSISLNYRRTHSARWIDGMPAYDVPPPYKDAVLAGAIWHALRGGWPAAHLLRHLTAREETRLEADKLAGTIWRAHHAILISVLEGERQRLRHSALGLLAALVACSPVVARELLQELERGGSRVERGRGDDGRRVVSGGIGRRRRARSTYAPVLVRSP